MRNHHKISLWALVLAATAASATLAMHTRAAAPEHGSAGSPVIAAANAQPTAITAEPADAVSIKSFGFLIFDRDPNSPDEMPGFGPLPSK